MKIKISSVLSLLTVGFVCTPVVTQAQYQTRNTHFGVSGGNINDISRRFCCSGTLGSLVTNGTTQYILSNNHVLARTDQAAAGEDISQPGLIDNNCQAPPIVADLTAKVALGNNVDCAIAAVRAGQMDHGSQAGRIFVNVHRLHRMVGHLAVLHSVSSIEIDRDKRSNKEDCSDPRNSFDCGSSR